MYRASLEKMSRHRVLVLLAAIVLILLVATPAAYAILSNRDGGDKTCPRGKRVALKVTGRGNPIYVRATRRDGRLVIYSDNFYTGSHQRTRYFYPQHDAHGYIDWIALVHSDRGSYVDRWRTYGYCH